MRHWPPARAGAETARLLDCAERSQPWLHAAHVFAALAFFALCGLSSSLASIAYAVLIGAWFIRLPGTLALNAALLRTPIAWLGIAWATWATMSGLWAIEGAQYAGQIKAVRFVLIVPALWPVIRLWPAFMVALVGGVALQNVVQVLQQAELFPPEEGSFTRHPGLAGHPGHTATWTAVALCVLVAAGATIPRKARFWLVAPSGLALLGLAIAAARGAIAGLVLALPATIGAIAWRCGIRSAARAVTPLALAVAVGAVVAGAITLGGSDWENIRRQAVQLNRVSTPGDAVGQRYVWWAAARQLWREHPVCGAGVGAYAHWMPESAAVKAAIADYPKDKTLSQLLRVHHPHSVSLQVLCELGLVGAAIAAAIALCTVVGAWRLTRIDVLGCGILGGAILWIVAAQFETLNLNGITGGLGAAIVAVATLGARVGAGRREGNSELGMRSRGRV